MRKHIIKLLAIVSTIVLCITSFTFFFNNKVKADEYMAITYENYFGWNPDYVTASFFINGDIRWGDLDGNGTIDNVDVQYLEHALKRDMYDGGFAARIVYDLADVAEPFGVIDSEDYSKLSAVACGEHRREELPIYQRVGYANRTSILGIMHLDGSNEQKIQSNDLTVAVGIYTGVIRCIGAPRVLALSNGSGNLANNIDTLNFVGGGSQFRGQDGIVLTPTAVGPGADYITIYPRGPENHWFEYGVDSDRYNSESYTIRMY